MAILERVMRYVRQAISIGRKNGAKMKIIKWLSIITLKTQEFCLELAFLRRAELENLHIRHGRHMIAADSFYCEGRLSNYGGSARGRPWKQIHNKLTSEPGCRTIHNYL